MTEVPIVQGWTGNLDFILEANGAAYDLSSASAVSAVAHRTGRSDAVVVDRAATVLDAAAGKVRFTPQSSDFTAKDGPYELRFKVTLGGQVVFFPNDSAIRLKVGY
jgi:hypothetical protein